MDDDVTSALRFELEPSVGPRVFVVGVDGSETSWHALYYAFGLARRQHGRVLAVFADATCRSVELEVDCYPDDTWSAREQLAAEIRDTIAALSAEQQVPAEFVTSRCEPVEALVKLADEHRADAIIVGASRTLVHKLFGGSNAVRTVRRSRCPVTVVP